MAKLVPQLGLGKAYEALDGLFTSLSESVERLDVFYTWYPPTRKDPIRIYGSEGSSVVDVSPIRFLENKVIPPYPYFCAWQYCMNISSDVQFHLDNFQEAEITKAWVSLAGNKNLFIFPRGDETHAGISAADIAARIVDSRLYRLARRRKRAGLYPEDLTQVLPEFKEDRRDFHFLGEKSLSFMYPLNPQAKIPIEDRHKHPIIFFVREKTTLGRETYEGSPLMNALLDMAYEMDGSLKFFSEESDHRRIKPEDYLVYVGEHGKKIGQTLRSLGYQISLINSEEIIRQRLPKNS